MRRIVKNFPNLSGKRQIVKKNSVRKICRKIVEKVPNLSRKETVKKIPNYSGRHETNCRKKIVHFSGKKTLIIKNLSSIT